MHDLVNETLTPLKTFYVGKKQFYTNEEATSNKHYKKIILLPTILV